MPVPAEDKRKTQRTADTQTCSECSAVRDGIGQAAVVIGSFFPHSPVTEHCLIRAIENS
jgi:hypothetical protein